MSDEIKKTDTDESVEAEEKAESIKKPKASKKKVEAKAKNIDDSKDDGSKKNISDKLKAMGLMSNGSTENIKEKASHEKGSFLKLSTVSIAATLIVGSFVWALNNDSKTQPATSEVSTSNPVHSNINQPSQSNTPRNNSYNQMQEQERYHKWVQQQQRWGEQQRQAQLQQRVRQQKWMQDQQIAMRKYYEQQRKWAQQSYNSYPYNMNNQRRPMPPTYNSGPR